MPDPSQSQEIASWIQTGGLLAFASAVYWEIRQIRPWMKAIFESLAILKDREESTPVGRPNLRRRTGQVKIFNPEDGGE